MKIIIAGGGKIGRSVAAILADEGHDITVIDRNSALITQISNELDVICVEGNATNAAGAEMNAIASSIIGGTLLSGGVGNVIGTFFGVLTLTTIKNIVTTSGLRDPWWQSITTGAMLCFFILLQSVVLSRRNKKSSVPIWLRRVRGRLPQLHK